MKPLKDPFSEICIKYCRQSCEVIFLETQNNYLNVAKGAYADEELDRKKESANQLKNYEIEDQQRFQENSFKLYNWSVSELFYIFTTCNMIQSNDQRKFCRQRVLNCSLRVLHAEYFWLKYIQKD